MTARFAAALENFSRLARGFNQRDPAMRRWIERAFGEDLDRAASAIRQLERMHDPALAVMAWAFFWIRQGDLPQARRELEAIDAFAAKHSLWSGLAVFLLGELYLEMGETKRGAKLIRHAQQILGEPP